MVKVGLKGESVILVEEHNTATVYGSGDLPVFGTPAMIALMERTALESVKDYLEEGFSTVGTLVNVKHVAATPLGMEVRCESELIEVDRKRLVFNVKAYDARGLIGEGTHERFIIHKERFLEKTNGK